MCVSSSIMENMQSIKVKIKGEKKKKKNSTDNIFIRIDQAEERICAVKDRIFEMTQSEKNIQKKKK